MTDMSILQLIPETPKHASFDSEKLRESLQSVMEQLSKASTVPNTLTVLDSTVLRESILKLIGEYNTALNLLLGTLTFDGAENKQSLASVKEQLSGIKEAYTKLELDFAFVLEELRRLVTVQSVNADLEREMLLKVEAELTKT